jgi:transposase
VVLDHRSVHQAEEVRRLIAARGCALRFLPAYSPDLTPSEAAFSTLKAGLRRVGARTRDALLDAIAQGLSTLTSADAHGWFEHAGYPLPVQPS